MMARISKWLGVSLGGALLAAGAVSAATLSNVSISKNAGNSPDVLPTGGQPRIGVRSITEVLEPTATSFEARYAMTGAADNDAFVPAVSGTYTADYTIEWDVTAGPGEAWVLEVGSSFRGGLTVTDDHVGFGIDSQPAASVSDLVCDFQGPGTVVGDPLDGFPSATSRNGTNDIFGNDVVVGFAAGSEIHGVGTGSPQTFTLDCTFQIFAASGQGFFAADDAGARFGADAPLTGSAVGYPGPWGATRLYQVDDGHRVAVNVKEFPPTTACNDGLDNDGDGLTDLDDLGCAWSGSTSEKPSCNDGIDNDGDGLVDLADPVCEGMPSRSEYTVAAACGLLGIEPFALLWFFRKRFLA